MVNSGSTDSIIDSITALKIQVQNKLVCCVCMYVCMYEYKQHLPYSSKFTYIHVYLP